MYQVHEWMTDYPFLTQFLWPIEICRIALKIKKFIKEHNRHVRIQDELKRQVIVCTVPLLCRSLIFCVLSHRSSYFIALSGFCMGGRPFQEFSFYYIIYFLVK